MPEELTSATASLAATARMSAQETIPGQDASSSSLMPSTTSKPLREFAFGPAVFSPANAGESSSSTDPSQPCAGERESLEIAGAGTGQY
ncbi:unnamed protein product [Spirodela intermedia]|uniref:Uncharacterized protein n=1 Tax=Spirodela intermedia TaxID=51605 RepID=A0A7I8L5E8_SPIIN|nr:unnamed protein product [Spirodela intermedia]